MHPQQYPFCTEGIKGDYTLVQFTGLFNRTVTPITRSTKRREGTIPSDNALQATVNPITM